MTRVTAEVLVARAPLVDLETIADQARLIVELRRARRTCLAVGRAVGPSRQTNGQIDREWHRRTRPGTASAA